MRKLALLADIHGNFPIANDWNRRLTFLGPRTIFYVPQGELTLHELDGKKVVINPGSVGQPRDGYAHATTAAKLRALPLSPDTRRYFADRLAEGR